MLGSLLTTLLAQLAMVVLSFTTPQVAQAWTDLRLKEVGGYGVILADSPTFAYGSLDSAVNGQVQAGKLVYLNAWQIGVYNIGDKLWVSQYAVAPILDANGNLMASLGQTGISGATIYNAPGGSQVGRYGAGVFFPIQKQGNGWYQLTANRWISANEGKFIDPALWRANLPAAFVPMAARVLANPPANVPVIYTGTVITSNTPFEMFDTKAVHYSSGEKVLATMRVTDDYDFVYVRNAPSPTAKIIGQVTANTLVNAFEIQGDWYRINATEWAPRVWKGSALLVPENVQAYAQPEYSNGGKWISIDLNRQQLTAWEGNEVVVSSKMKSGKYGHETPTGVFHTFAKLPSARMSGTDYDLLDVAWTQYFTPNGAAIHSAYWHNNYNGHPGSHGCVNTPPEVAEKLFMWAPLGTTIVTYDDYVFTAQDIADASKWNEFERTGP